MNEMHSSIRHVRKKKNPGRRCDSCNAKAGFSMEIAFSFMRGEDETMILCESCKNHALQDPFKVWDDRVNKVGS